MVSKIKEGKIVVVVAGLAFIIMLVAVSTFAGRVNKGAEQAYRERTGEGVPVIVKVPGKTVTKEVIKEVPVIQRIVETKTITVPAPTPSPTPTVPPAIVPPTPTPPVVVPPVTEQACGEATLEGVCKTIQPIVNPVTQPTCHGLVNVCIGTKPNENSK